MKKQRIVATGLCLLSAAICASSQGLFESVQTDSSTAQSSTSVAAKPVDFSGYVKGAVFGGYSSAHDLTIFGAYGQAAAVLDAQKANVGKLHAEVRLNAGKDRGNEAVNCDVREAWGALDPAGFNLKVGRQIIVWGRADAVNPTNNITPKNELVLSSENDDSRLGNELVYADKKIGCSSIQGIWVPYYRADVIPINSSIMPAGISLKDPVYPDMKFRNGGYALRWELNAPSVDGSLSYFNGYATLPGFNYSLDATGMSLVPTAYRMQVFGGDVSSAIGSVGLRAELAVKVPYDRSDDKIYIPQSYGQAVVGVDKSIGNWSVLLQYSGLYVIDYKKVADPVLTDPSDPIELQIYGAGLAKANMERMNRLFTGTSDELSHSVTANVQWNTMHETLHFKLAGLYNFTTNEYAVVPGASYDVADAVCLSVGGRYLEGDKGSMSHLVSNLMSTVYAELKLSF